MLLMFQQGEVLCFDTATSDSHVALNAPFAELLRTVAHPPQQKAQ